MTVSVGETRQHTRSVQVYHLGAGSGQGTYFGIIAYGQDTASTRTAKAHACG